MPNDKATWSPSPQDAHLEHAENELVKARRDVVRLRALLDQIRGKGCGQCWCDQIETLLAETR